MGGSYNSSRGILCVLFLPGELYVHPPTPIFARHCPPYLSGVVHAPYYPPNIRVQVQRGGDVGWQQHSLLRPGALPAPLPGDPAATLFLWVFNLRGSSVYRQRLSLPQHHRAGPRARFHLHDLHQDARHAYLFRGSRPARSPPAILPHLHGCPLDVGVAQLSTSVFTVG